MPMSVQLEWSDCLHTYSYVRRCTESPSSLTSLSSLASLSSTHFSLIPFPHFSLYFPPHTSLSLPSLLSPRLRPSFLLSLPSSFRTRLLKCSIKWCQGYMWTGSTECSTSLRTTASCPAPLVSLHWSSKTFSLDKRPTPLG